jgi:putative membrane protein
VPLYEAHAEGATLWGLELIVDQQLAGALMWIPAGLVYSAAALVLFFAWLRSADQAAVRRDEAGWISLDAGRF